MSTSHSHPNYRRLLAVAFGLVSILTLAVSGLLSPRPTPRYTVTDLGVLPGDNASEANGINNHGEIVGLSVLMYHRVYQPRAFLYRNHTMTDLGVNAAISGGPALNNHGQTTGGANTCRFISQSYLYSGGLKHDLSLLPGFRESFGSAINDRGQIVGEMQGGQRGSRAFLYAGYMINLGVLPGYQESAATAINANGQVVGTCSDAYLPTQAFTWNAQVNKMMPLALPPGFKDGQASGLNDAGEIIGTASTSADVPHVMLWQGGQVKDLGMPPGTDSAQGAAINTHGDAVGWAWVRPNAVSQLISDHPVRLGLFLPLADQQVKERACLYYRGCLVDLNTLLPVHSGWTLEEAKDINDQGQIVGEGQHDGQERAFLLTPIR